MVKVIIIWDKTHLRRSSWRFLAVVVIIVGYRIGLWFEKGAFFTVRTILKEETERDYQVCRASNASLYYCEGPQYDQFAEKFEAFLTNRTNMTHDDNGQVRYLLPPSSNSRCWGKRPFPFRANTRVLAVGNSHTRQVLLSLKCQYPTLQYLEPEFNDTDATIKRRATYYILEFLNHATLHLLTNHALFYSRKWREYLESTVNNTLEYFDLLIVGKINTFTEAYNTSFMALMMEKTAELEEADFTAVPPPTLYDFARVYSGPIIAHSMMADYGQDILNRQMIGLVRAVNRANVHFVNGRSYIPLLGECSSNLWDQVVDCMPGPSAHRCIGSRGGHPDLVAWDIIEAANNYTNSCSPVEFGKNA